MSFIYKLHEILYMLSFYIAHNKEVLVIKVTITGRR